MRDLQKLFEQKVQQAAEQQSAPEEPSRDEIRKVLKALSSRGGKARWKGSTPEERSAFARKGARKSGRKGGRGRWRNKTPEERRAHAKLMLEARRKKAANVRKAEVSGGDEQGE